jgi:putative tryptophan/tyrosine transport system substrate-binding protein
VKFNQIRYISTFLVVLWAFFAYTETSFAGKETGTIGIVFGTQVSYSKAVSVLKPALEKMGFQCVLVELPKSEKKILSDNVFQPLLSARPRLVVALGAQAVSLALARIPTVPVVFCMVPNALDTPFMAGNFRDRKRLTGLTTDISPRDQIEWIHKLNPECTSLGILYSSRTRSTAQSIKLAGEAARIKVVMIEADKDKISDAIKALAEQECGGVLMLPDASIYNSVNVRELMLWGLRQKKPVWAFSANIVKAGAFAGQYFDPDSVGDRTAQLVRKILKNPGKDGLGLLYAEPIQTAVNLRTADMLGISIDEKTLKTINMTCGKE